MYTVRAPYPEPKRILFLERIRAIFAAPEDGIRKDFSLYLTGDYQPAGNIMRPPDPNLGYLKRRFEHTDLIDHLPALEQRKGTVAYVCGPPKMTDDVVDFLKGLEGISEERVLCEKWW